MSDEFVKKVDELTVNIAALRADVQRKDALINSLRDENDVLKKSSKHLNAKVNDAEIYQRRNNLIFTGLPLCIAGVAAGSNDLLSDSSEFIASQIATFCSDRLVCPVAVQSISVAHALQSRGNQKNSQSVIVRFSSRFVRDNVYYSRMNLKNYCSSSNTKVYINEDLTSVNRKILLEARRKHREKSLTSVWINSGYVYCKDDSDVSHCLRSLQDLAAF